MLIMRRHTLVDAAVNYAVAAYLSIGLEFDEARGATDYFHREEYAAKSRRCE
jgi:hypothetical protein